MEVTVMRKYLLIKVSQVGLFHTRISTSICHTPEEAYQTMKQDFCKELDIEGADNYITRMEEGIQFSNMTLTNKTANLYLDCGNTSCHWKIIEIQ